MLSRAGRWWSTGGFYERRLTWHDKQTEDGYLRNRNFTLHIGYCLLFAYSNKYDNQLECYVSALIYRRASLLRSYTLCLLGVNSNKNLLIAFQHRAREETEGVWIDVAKFRCPCSVH